MTSFTYAIISEAASQIEVKSQFHSSRTVTLTLPLTCELSSIPRQIISSNSQWSVKAGEVAHEFSNKVNIKVSVFAFVDYEVQQEFIGQE
ncbi:hypothetical protein EUGRSUZ_J01080 [Eucalyptus grandis]|uniref:Uncharacterized protein n=2 Tax=Eucalyptus grandis TaxID=71139 RepID=A0ACC3J5K7_EUCGR|nr:hypothetical protein EUGRSUZ_J01080 [Eucalyptus grandis]